MTERDAQRGDGESGRCHRCGRSFPTQKELSEHLMAAHEDEGLSVDDEASPR